MRKGLRWNDIWGCGSWGMQRVNLYSLFPSPRPRLTSYFHCGLHLNIDNDHKKMTFEMVFQFIVRWSCFTLVDTFHLFMGIKPCYKGPQYLIQTGKPPKILETSYVSHPTQT